MLPLSPNKGAFTNFVMNTEFYVCNEANIESHGMGYDLRKGRTLGNNPNWLNRPNRSDHEHVRNREELSLRHVLVSGE